MAFKAANLLGLARALKEMRKVPSRVSTRFAQWVHEEMQRNYNAGVNPYGGAHAPLKQSTIDRKGHALVLRESFAMMNSTRAEPLRGAGIILRVDPDYAILHMTGWGDVDARPFFPYAGMPAKWRQELRRMVAEEYRR